jgi:tetratricopeptide (TPR) repeat protein
MNLKKTGAVIHMSRKILRALGALAVFAAIAGTACQKEERGEPLGGTSDGTIPIGARTALDDGNTFYRGGQYEAALASYEQAVGAAPGEAAPWYGVYMAATALGNKTLADSALRQINALGQVDGALSDSTMRDMHTGGGMGGTMPLGHPPTENQGAMPGGHPPVAPQGALPKGHPTPGPAGSP